jgi:Fur family peroxide stress response transcriptional regulator
MNKYRSMGLKLTPQRLGILVHLEGNTTHPSADEIFSKLKKSFPTMSLSTVYNTLEALQKKGRLTELSIDPDRKRYDPNISPHHHLICLHCKKIADIYVEYNLSIPEEQKGSFEIAGNHVVFYGVCSACKGKSV